MVEFEYQPYDKVIVHEITKIPLNLYILTRSLGAQDGGTAPPLSWIDGIVFEHSLLPATDVVVNEMLKGTIHWNNLTYADMKDFKDELDGPRAVKVPVIKQEARIFSELKIWLKEVYEPSLK